MELEILKSEGTTVYSKVGSTFTPLGQPAALSTDGRGAAWSPDGRFIAFALAATPFVTWYFHDGFGELAVNNDVKALIPGVDIFRGRDTVRALAPVAAGGADMELNNRAGTYDQGKVLRQGLPIRIRATWSGTDYDLFTGLCEDLIQHPEKGRRTTEVPLIGTLSRLVGKKISTELYQDQSPDDPLTTDIALGHLLDAAGWPTDERSLETGVVKLDWWWLDEEDAYQAALDLMRTEGVFAALHENGDGYVHFWNRDHYSSDAEAKTIQQTFRDSGAAPNFVKPFEYDEGLRNVVNQASVTVKTRTAKSLAAIWSLGATLVIRAYESRSFDCRDDGGHPFTAERYSGQRD